jgi:hypothetical protein
MFLNIPNLKSKYVATLYNKIICLSVRVMFHRMGTILIYIPINMKTACGAPLTIKWPKLTENNIFQPTTNRLVCVAEVKWQKGTRNYEFFLRRK